MMQLWACARKTLYDKMKKHGADKADYRTLLSSPPARALRGLTGGLEASAVSMKVLYSRSIQRPLYQTPSCRAVRNRPARW